MSLCILDAVAAEADFLGFGNEEAAQEAFMPDSPPAESSQRPGGQAFQPSYPTPPGSNSSQQAATPDGLADFFSAPAGPSASSSGASHTPSSTAHIDDMFSAGPKPKTAAAAAASSAQSSSVNARSQGAPSSSSGAAAGARATPKAAQRAAAPSSMIDFGDEAALLAEHPDLYKGLEEVPGKHLRTFHIALHVLRQHGCAAPCHAMLRHECHAMLCAEVRF